MNRIPVMAVFLLASMASSPIFARSFPDSLLPPCIKAVLDSGDRPDWSHDGKKILFLNRAGGSICEIELSTKIVRSIFKAPSGLGCWRALYLSNEDFFITCGTGRYNAYAYIQNRDITKPAVRLNTIIKEGPAISRTKLKICYTSDDSTIVMADIVYTNGVPSFANGKVIVDRSKIFLNGVKISPTIIEPQNFRPPLETALTMNAFKYNGTDALLYNITANTFYNITDGPCCEEPEGIFPDGRHTLVESNRHTCNPASNGTANIDIYYFNFTNPKEWTRLTNFNDVATFKASNPVVRDDGKVFAFMEGRTNTGTDGAGIYVFDLVAAGYYSPPVAVKTPRLSAPAAGKAVQGHRTVNTGLLSKEQGRTQFDLNGRVLDTRSNSPGSRKAPGARISLQNDPVSPE